MRKVVLILILLLTTLFIRGQERLSCFWGDSVANETILDTLYILDLDSGKYNLIISVFDFVGNEKGRSDPLNINITHLQRLSCFWMDNIINETTLEMFYALYLEPGKYNLIISVFDFVGNEKGRSNPVNINVDDILPPSTPGNLREKQNYLLFSG